MPLPKAVTPVHFLGFSVFQPFHFPLPCLLHVSDFPDCARAPVCFFTWLKSLPFYLSCSSLGFLLFIFPNTDKFWVLFRCCFHVCFLTLHACQLFIFWLLFSYMYVSFSFFGFSFGLVFMYVFLHACQFLVFLCWTRFDFSFGVVFMHLFLHSCCLMFFRNCMLTYRVCLFLVLLLFYFGAVFMCVFLHACQLFIYLCFYVFILFIFLMIVIFFHLSSALCA